MYIYTYNVEFRAENKYYFFNYNNYNFTLLLTFISCVFMIKTFVIYYIIKIWPNYLFVINIV